MLDSTADFLDRASKLGATRDEIQNLQQLGYDTLGKLAFATSYTPGQQDYSALLKLAADITGQDPAPAPRLSIVRRLFFESSRKMTVCQGSWPMQSVPRAMRTSADALAELK